MSAVETLGWQAPSMEKGEGSGMGGGENGPRRENTPTDQGTEIPDSEAGGFEFA